MSETALLEISSQAQMGFASAEAQRQLIREKAVQALQDKESIIESLKVQCHVLAGELASVGAALNAEMVARTGLEAKMEETEKFRDLFMNKFFSQVGKKAKPNT